MARYSFSAVYAVTKGSLGPLYVRLVADATDMVLGFTKAKSAVRSGTVAVNKDLALMSQELAALSAQFIGLGRAAMAANTQMSAALASSAAAAAASTAAMATKTAQMSAQTQAAAAGAATAAATMGKAATGTGIALGIVGAIGVNQYAKLEQAVMGAAAVLGDTNEQIRGEMEKTVRDVGKQSINNAIEQAGALEILASAGYDAEGSMKLLRVADRFAIAGHMSLTKATDSLISSQGALGLKTGDVAQDFKNMTRIANALTMANRFGQGSIEEFADALTHGGAQAIKMANKELEEGIAMLAAWAEAGDKGATGGEHAFMAMRDIQRVASEFSDVWENVLGIDVYDKATGKLKHFGDIFSEFQKKLMSMSDIDRRRTLSESGLQERAMKAMVTMLSQAPKIRGWYEDLLKASGEMDKVANDRLNTLINQWRITKNNMQDLFFTVGKELTPAMKELNKAIRDITEGIAGTGGEVSTFAYLATSVIQLLRAIGLGLQFVWKVAEQATDALSAIPNFFIAAWPIIKNFFSEFWNYLKQTVAYVATVFGSIVVTMLAQALRLVPGMGSVARKMLDDHKLVVKQLDKEMEQSAGRMGDIFLDFQRTFSDMSNAYDKRSTERWARWKERSKKLSDDIFGEAEKKVEASADLLSGLLIASNMTSNAVAMAWKKASESVKGSFKEMFAEDSTAIKVRLRQANKEVEQFFQSNGLGDNATGRQLHTFLPRDTQDRLDAYQKEQSALASIKLMENERARLNRKYQLEEDFGFSKQIENQKTLANLYQIQSQRKVTLDPFAGLIGSDIDQASSIEMQIEEQEYANKIYEELRKSEYYSNQQSQEMLTELIEYHTERRKQLQLSQARVLMSSYSNMFDSMATAAKDFAGEQSGIYKTMFAASKAFAIAEATVKIAQSIAKAAGEAPWPVKLAAIAEAVSSGAQIMSMIAATRLTFEGERASGGPVSGGSAYLVGERGPEAFVPKQSGTILPNDFLSSGGNVQLVVNNYAGIDVQTSERETQEGKRIEVNLRRIKNELASDIRDGRGDFSRAIEASYGLRRSGR